MVRLPEVKLIDVSAAHPGLTYTTLPVSEFDGALLAEIINSKKTIPEALARLALVSVVQVEPPFVVTKI